MTSPEIDVGSARREPTGARKREDSVSTFVVTARDGQAPRRGSLGRTFFLLVLLVAAAGAAWWFYGEALGLGSPASLGLDALLPVARAPDAGASVPASDDAGGVTTLGAEGASLDAGERAPGEADAGPGDAGAADAGTASDAGGDDARVASDAGGDAGSLDEEPPARGRAARRRRRPRRR